MRRRARTVAVIALIGTALAAAAALAATAPGSHPVHPTPNRYYKGTTSLAPAFGVPAWVDFSVSGSARKLLRFRYAQVGCEQAYTLLQSPYLDRGSIRRVGTVAVDRSGTFAAHGRTSRAEASDGTVTTVTAVHGRFTSPRRAAGTITFRQRFQAAGGHPRSCGRTVISFTARVSRTGLHSPLR